MKKLLSFLLSFILAASVLGCAQTNPEESTSDDKSEIGSLGMVFFASSMTWLNSS